LANLLVDIGNTRIKWAIIDNWNLQFEIHTNSDFQEFLQIIQQHNKKIKNAIFSSVHYDKEFIQNAFTFIDNVIFLNHDTPIPIHNLYQTPESLGKDRLCNVIAANILFPNKNVLVIDCGTCIKYDAINNKGEYYGGSISPGLKMRYKALHHFTAKLPLLQAEVPETFMGSNTAQSLHTGVVQGIAHEMNGFIAQYNSYFKEDLTIIITGGDADFLVKHINYKIFAQNNLVLLALSIILKYNVDK